ncbi:MAG: Dabb family protein [Oscillospiraceae bacterium]|nr:Dabb family protein [Oscillospiraceae bacterium]
MVKHIVLYNFKEGVNKEEAIQIIRDALVPLVGQIPGLRHLEVNLTFQGMDYALYSEFDSREAMENYAVHPLHLAAKEKFFQFIGTRVAADYLL